MKRRIELYELDPSYFYENNYPFTKLNCCKFRLKSPSKRVLCGSFRIFIYNGSIICNQLRRNFFSYSVCRDDTFCNIITRRQFKHHIKHNAFNDRTKAARTCFSFNCFFAISDNASSSNSSSTPSSSSIF